MKKHVLSFVAISLTLLVSCKNYDDQFVKLNSDVDRLTLTANTLAAVQASLTTLKNDVDFLESSTGTSTLSLNAMVTSLETQLGLASTDPEINTVSITIASIQENVDDLLKTNSVIQQDVKITNPAELDLFTRLVPSSNDTTVTIRGSLTVTYVPEIFDNGNGLLKTNLDTVLSKVKSVIGDVIINSPTELAFNKLSFITGNLILQGTKMSLPELKTISKGLILNYAGDHNYSTLTNIEYAALLPISTASATTFNMSGVNFLDEGRAIDAIITEILSTTALSTTTLVATISADPTSIAVVTPLATASSSLSSIPGLAAGITSDSFYGKISLDSATTINTGNAYVTGLTLPKANTVTVGYTGSLGNVTMGVGSATTSIQGDAKSFSNLTITSGAGTSTLAINFPLATTISNISIDNASSVNFPALTTSKGTLNITADTIDLSAVTSLSATAGASVIKGNVNLTLLANLSHSLTLNTLKTVNLPNLTTNSILTLPVATTVTLKSISSASLIATKASNITISNFESNATFLSNTSSYPNLAALSITASELVSPTTVPTNTVEISNSSTLTTVTLGGIINNVRISGTSSLTTLNTSGNITTFTIDNSDVLTSLTLGHSNLNNLSSSITVTNNDKLASLITSNLDRISTIQITDNTALETISLSSFVTLPGGGGGVPTINILRNNLKGKFLPSRPSTADNNFYKPAEITSTSWASLETALKAYNAASTTIFLNVSLEEVEIETVSGGVTTTTTNTLTNALAITTADADFSQTLNLSNSIIDLGTSINTLEEYIITLPGRALVDTSTP